MYFTGSTLPAINPSAVVATLDGFVARVWEAYGKKGKRGVNERTMPGIIRLVLALVHERTYYSESDDATDVLFALSGRDGSFRPINCMGTTMAVLMVLDCMNLVPSVVSVAISTSHAWIVLVSDGIRQLAFEPTQDTRTVPRARQQNVPGPVSCVSYKYECGFNRTLATMKDVCAMDLANTLSAVAKAGYTVGAGISPRLWVDYPPTSTPIASFLTSELASVRVFSMIARIVNVQKKTSPILLHAIVEREWNETHPYVNALVESVLVMSPRQIFLSRDDIWAIMHDVSVAVLKVPLLLFHVSGPFTRLYTLLNEWRAERVLTKLSLEYIRTYTADAAECDDDETSDSDTDDDNGKRGKSARHSSCTGIVDTVFEDLHVYDTDIFRLANQLALPVPKTILLGAYS